MNNEIKTHKDLNVWQESMNLAKVVYHFTGTFPKEERYGLTSQMRRAAVSIPSNIAEGAARASQRKFIQYLDNLVPLRYKMCKFDMKIRIFTGFR